MDLLVDCTLGVRRFGRRIVRNFRTFLSTLLHDQPLLPVSLAVCCPQCNGNQCNCSQERGDSGL